MINWARVYDLWYASALVEYVYWSPVMGLQCERRLDNLSKCLGAAATEHARLRYTMCTVFGWPFHGKY